MKIVFAFILTAIMFQTVYSQNYKQVKIYISSQQDIKNLQDEGLEFDHPNLSKDNSCIVFINDSEYEKLQKTSFKFDILIDDWYEHYNNLPKLSLSEKTEFIEKSKREMNVSGFGFGSMGGFYTLAEVITELDNMKTLYPNLITSKISIGNSVENRSMYMVKISDNPDLDENEPEILYTALHHAREPQSMMQMIYFHVLSS